MCENPKILNDLSKNSSTYNFRDENLTEENFQFHKFLTDKEKAQMYLTMNQSLFHKNSIYQPPQFHPRNESQTNNQTLIKQNEKILQPIMRFKPRTDLERIFDSINLNYFGKMDREIVNEQLRRLDLIKIINKTKESSGNELNHLKERLKVNQQTLNFLIKEKNKIENSENPEENQEFLDNINDIIRINKGLKEKENGGEKVYIYNNPRKDLNNFLARNILGDYHKKTHFQAVSVYMNKLNNKNSPSFISNNFGKKRKLNNNKKNNEFINFDDNNNIANDNYDYEKFQYYEKSFQNPFFKFKKKHKNINNYDNDINFDKINLKEEKENKEKLKKLKILATSSEFYRNYNINNENNNLNNFKSMNNIKFNLNNNIIINNNNINDNNGIKKYNNEDRNEKLQEANMPKYVNKYKDKIEIDGKWYDKNDLYNISKIVMKKCNMIPSKINRDIYNYNLSYNNNDNN